MVPLRLQRMGMIARRVAVEVRPSEILWALSEWRPGGSRLRGLGREPRAEGENNQHFFERFSATHGLANADVAVLIRHPDLAASRLDLPPLSDRDARRVAERRAEQLASENPEPAIAAYVVAPGKGPRPAWMVACPEEFSSFALERLRSQGLPVTHVGSMHLALGALTRSMAAPEEGQLRAFLDIGADHAVCVLADAEGWLFSREVPIRLTRVGDGADDESNPVERLASELRRTFHYIHAELRLGTVTELLLSGGRENLDELAESIDGLLDVSVCLVGDEITAGPAANIDPVFGAVVGAALMPRLGGANLLPQEALRTLTTGRARRRLWIATAASVAMLIGGVTHFLWSQWDLTTQWDDLERTWQEGSPQRAAVETSWESKLLADEVGNALEALGPPRSVWSWALSTLEPMLPDDAFIAKLSGDRVNGEWAAALEIEFRGADLASAAEAGSRFAAELDASPLFRVESVARGAAPSGGSLIPYDDSAVSAHFRIESRIAPIRFSQRDEVPKGRDVGEGVDNG